MPRFGMRFRNVIGLIVAALVAGGGMVFAQDGSKTPAAMAGRADDPSMLDAFAAADRVDTARGWLMFLTRFGDTDFGPRALARLRARDLSTFTKWSPMRAEEALGLTLSQRGLIQLRLIAAGYEIADANGELDADTRAELRRYQADNGFEPTGHVGPALFVKLRLGELRPVVTMGSHPRAQLYDPADLALLGEDERVVKAAQCMKGDRYIYGEFGGRLYVAVAARSSTAYFALRDAERCGAYMVTIGSKAENDFVYDLFRDDPRMLYEQSHQGNSMRKGPLIGLRQRRGSREPRGGWEWPNGEPLRFTNWAAGNPDNYGGYQDQAVFFAYRQGSRLMANVEARTWDDQTSADGASGYVLKFE